MGQGGLCEGWLVDGHSPQFRWVYDCGSNQSGPLNREIGRIRGDIDLLFLSHLDADHVNGIDALLANRPTTEVVLPYLNDEERIVLMGAAASAGAASGALLEFARDPAAWLLQRGVARVTFIRGGDDGEGYDPDRPDEPLLGKPEMQRERGSLRWGWTMSTPISESGDVQEIPAGAALEVLSLSSGAIWTLLPYAHRPAQRLLQAFKDELTLRFGPLTPPAAAQQARTHAGREALVACYEKIWGDHNLVSMSLYAGPHHANAEHWITDIHARPHRRIGRALRCSGWISTGDAKLAVKARRAAFRRFFEAYLGTTAVLVTPHHGAATSWDDDVLSGFDRLRIGCAAAGPNGYDHPNQKVIDAIETHGAIFITVAEQDRTDLILRTWG